MSLKWEDFLSIFFLDVKYILIGFLLITLHTFGENENPLPFNFFTISGNVTSVANENTQNKFGFGIGLYRIPLDSNKIKFSFGMEYNSTNQLKESVYYGHFASGENITYRINTFSFPFKMHYNFGKKNMFFFSGGLFFDLL